MLLAIYTDEGISPEAAREAASRAVGASIRLEVAGKRCLLGWDETQSRVTTTSDDAHVAIGSGSVFDGASVSSELLSRFNSEGPKGPGRIAGQFAGFVANKQTDSLYVVRDHLGVEPLYFSIAGKWTIISSSARVIAKLSGSAALDHSVVGRFFCFNYNPGRGTVWKGIDKFPPAHYAMVGSDGFALERYWDLRFAEKLPLQEPEIVEQLRSTMKSAILSRAAGIEDPAIFVSGGLDSSTVLGVVSAANSSNIHTFSYRCRGVGFDESHYARLMAESAGSEHTELEYSPQNVEMMTELVGQMEEPFCDVGINIATGLLGRAAASVSSHALTGDGGDELFGGHPIYEADKVASYTDRLPAGLLKGVGSVLALLPDSDKKKTLAVKLKRFGESLRFPRSLGTHRWRLYYILEDLRGLLNSDVAASIDADSLFGDVIETYRAADSDELLDRTLYSDYQTIVDFYLRRNDLNRYLGLETRYPFFDIPLVELCAKVPSSLKIAGWFDTKYIMKKTIEPWLPHEIVYRKDKLGHSIPLKNWLRDDPGVREFVGDLVSASKLEARGLVDPGYVRKLWDEHMKMTANHSHRLWALAVFELWLQVNVDPLQNSLSD